jgi:hypothetical protein
VIVVECCGEIAGQTCKLLKKLAGTTRLELATSAVTGQRSNQLNYVPSFVGKLQVQASDCWADDPPDNLISLTDDWLSVIWPRLAFIEIENARDTSFP